MNTKPILTNKHLLPGTLLVLLLTGLAFLIAPYVSFGTPLVALIMGMIFSNFLLKREKTLKSGVEVFQKKGLELSIVLLGFSVNLQNFNDAKFVITIPLVVLVGVVLSIYIGKSFKLTKNESILLAFGNGICGSAAIGAAASILKAKPSEVGSTLPTINFLGVILLFLLPLFFPLFSAPKETTFLIGTTLQSVGHVGALAGAFDDSFIASALSFKMIRVALLFPACLILSQMVKTKIKDVRNRPPIYIWCFAIAITLNYFFQLEIFHSFVSLGKILLSAAMTAIGLNTSITNLLKKSPRLFAAGSVSIIVIVILNLLVLIS